MARIFRVDLNSDVGESFGNYSIGDDSNVLRYVTSANIACGWHAGDPMVMDATIKLAKEYGVAIGAHPGFNDLMGFGRRNMHVTPEEMKAYTKFQLGALQAFSLSHGCRVQHVKPHGAMYNMAAKDAALARAIAEAIDEVDAGIILLGLANSEMIRQAELVGLRTASEVFADRAYQSDGNLVPRSLPGSVIHDVELALERTVRMVKAGMVTSVDGKDIPIKAQSICVHGDNPEAVDFVKQIRSRLEAEGIVVTPIANII